MNALTRLCAQLARLEWELVCGHPEAYEEISQKIDSVKQEIECAKRPRKTKKE